MGLEPVYLQGVVSREIVSREEWLEWRRDNVNASDAACLWGDGIHPYVTAYLMWARHARDQMSPKRENPAMRRGRLLEPVALELAKSEKPAWVIYPAGQYLHHPEWRIGCTPDAYIKRWGQDGGPPDDGVLQIKTVGYYAFKNTWKKPSGEIEPPLWVAVQATIEAILSGRDFAVVGAMVISDGGMIDMHLIDIPIKPGILTQLRAKVNDFWRRIDADDPYPIDWSRDAGVVMDLYRDDDGSEVDLTGDEWVAEKLLAREGLKATEKAGDDAAKVRKLIDAQIINRLGNARIGRIGDRYIRAATVSKNSYTVQASSYRTIRIYDGAKQ